MGGPGSGPQRSDWRPRVEDVPDRMTIRAFAQTYKDELGDGRPSITNVRGILVGYEPCRFGGHRLRFHCHECARRSDIVYLVEGVLACRQCHGLTYRRKSKSDLASKRLSRVQARLGKTNSRPRNMHRKTFNKLRIEAEELAVEALSNMPIVAKVFGNLRRDREG
jgi:hypothetical protein